MRSMTRAKAGTRWKNDVPKFPVTVLPREARELDRERIVQAPASGAGRRWSASGASGMMRDDGVAAGVQNREGHQRDPGHHDHQPDEPADDERGHGTPALASSRLAS